MKLLGNKEATTNEMFLYDVNDFDPKDEEKVFILMRSVHHQFAKRLMELFPYDRNKFLTISRSRYIESTKLIADFFKGKTQGYRLFSLSSYANKRGFLTFHSFLSAEDDFAEIISAKLTHTPKEAYKELTEKEAFVEDYFIKEIKISLDYLQTISIKQLKAYTK